METARQRKRRLVREAVESNFKKPRSAFVATPAERKPSRSLWSGASLLLAVFIYFLLPAQLVSIETETGARTHAAKTRPGDAAPTTHRALQQEMAVAPHAIKREVFPLAVRKIVIDPGHGGVDTGAISDSGVSEKELTLDIALRLRRLMEKDSFHVIMTRETDRTVPLDKRVALANESGADIFVSIHVNWMEPRRLRPLETYFVGPTEDPAVMQLASMENRDSGYSLSDYRQLLDKVYTHMRRDESRRLAETIHTELYYSLREINPALDNRGVKTAPFIVLIGTQMPAVLVEISSLSNEDEVKLLTSSHYREEIALAISRGIRTYAEMLNRPNRKGSDKNGRN
jgi:N-acetylmuramoyl-L-alanine amidase